MGILDKIFGKKTAKHPSGAHDHDHAHDGHDHDGHDHHGHAHHPHGHGKSTPKG